MPKKKRNIDVLSVKLDLTQESSPITFVDILNYINGKKYRYKEKIFNLSILNTTKTDCVLGIIETTQDSDIPPKRNKTTGVYNSVQINTEQEGFAYANIFIYDYKRNILLYEINRNGCYPNQLKDFLYYHWNRKEDFTRFEISFPAVVRANEYKRMLSMDWYKRIIIELYNPTEIVNCIEEGSDSIYNNIIKQQIKTGTETNANTIRIEQISLQKKINPMGLSRSMIKGLVDAVKLNFADKGHRTNIHTLLVEGYISDSEDSNKIRPIDLIADSFNEHFNITDVQVHSDVQQDERKEGIEGLYDKLLPEFKQLIGF